MYEVNINKIPLEAHELLNTPDLSGSCKLKPAEPVDQDWDIPDEFDQVSFMFGDYESSTLSPQTFVELMQVITDHPEKKETIERTMMKLKERYT